MDEGSIIRLLIACGVGALLGGHVGSNEQGYGGAHMVGGFAVLAAIGAWSNSVSFNWLEVVAPISFAYAAAALAISVRKDRR